MRERTKDDLGTPAHILARVRQSMPYMRIALDPCSNAWTRETVGASRYCDIDEGTDGLLASWHEHDLGGTFQNPPYSRGQLIRWARKAAEEAALGCVIVSLFPHDCTTRWWQVMLATCSARCDSHQRIPFDGGAHKTGQIKSAFFYHGPHPHRFADAFEDLGEVIVYPRRRAA